MAAAAVNNSPDPARFFAHGLSDAVGDGSDVLAGDGGVAHGFREELIGLKDRLLAELERDAPSSGMRDVTVYTGRAGYAFMYWRLSKLDDANRQSHLAKAWRHLRSCLKRLEGRRISFLCGDPGVRALAAVVAHDMGDSSVTKEQCQVLTQFAGAAAQHLDHFPDELLYGRAGTLWALLFVRQNCGGGDGGITDETVKKVLEAMVTSGRRYSQRHKSPYPLMYQWHDSEYLGAAHGLAGILYLLLACKDLLAEDVVVGDVKRSLDKLAELDQFDSGNFRSSVGSGRDRLVQFCHGAPGVIYTYLKAAEVFPEEAGKYMGVAERCGEVIWKAGVLRKGYGLCHGTAGNAYALLALSAAQRRQDREDRAAKSKLRALRFAKWCVTDYGKRGTPAPDEPFCLMNGSAGTVVFLAEVAEDKAKFPCYEI